MGVLRILLALGVLLEHNNVWLIAGSHTAFEMFFMISGFYMALIYGRRYDSAMNFYKSRFFRLFPVYWAACALSLLYFVIAERFGIRTLLWLYEGHFTGMPHWMQAWLILANTFVLSADLSKFLSHTDFGLPKEMMYFMIIGPIWTVALELYFYLLCPWLLKWKSRTLLLVIGACLFARIIAYTYGLNADPWHARFFPFELPFFLFGVLGCRAFLRFSPAIADLSRKRGVRLALIGYLAVVLFYYPLAQFLPFTLYQKPDYLASWLLYLATAAALPFLFFLSKNSRVDRELGEFSYPIYLAHYPLTIIFEHSKMTFPFGLPAWVPVLITTLATSLILIALQRRVDRYRLAKYAAI